MIQSAWLFIGAMGALATGAAFRSEDNADATLFGVVGLVTWLVWAYGALSIEIADGGVVFEFNAPAVALLGVVFASVPGVVAILGALEIFGEYNERSDFEEM
jgi:hypothetical protein